MFRPAIGGRMHRRSEGNVNKKGKTRSSPANNARRAMVGLFLRFENLKKARGRVWIATVTSHQSFNLVSFNKYKFFDCDIIPRLYLVVVNARFQSTGIKSESM